ncbi:hypothetical protein CFHF_14985 [Caulobacter flavus]|uniref:Uncharacterized protein n=1 Tax=Caulobacter flavus TaxID=1679497 RepID=A0A2N5CRW9_9CAUL|nr:DUF6683 family protein [Caulobacter flavus]AYV46443.1 hypothetical protein C1707_09300 [Caulobacter flavus]PLR12741.1 hypothetical protein CFHF_14985 [Caulobacter flavus]
MPRLSLAASLAVAALTLAAGLAGPAAAQEGLTVLPNDFVMNDILNQQRIEAAVKAGRGGASAKARPAPPAAGAKGVTTYRASPAVSAKARRQFVDFVSRTSGAEGGRKVADALARQDPVRSWASIVASDGLKPGDAADALAGYWILNWVMANGADNDRAQTQAVLAQVRPIIAGNPAYARLTEPQRQEFAETLMLNFLLQHAAYVDAMQRGDAAAKRRLGDAAVARFRAEMGVDLRALSLTKTGFVRR